MSKMSENGRLMEQKQGNKGAIKSRVKITARVNKVTQTPYFHLFLLFRLFVKATTVME